MREARTVAVEAALEEKARERDELRRRMDMNLPRLSEEKLSTVLAQCCGGNTVVQQIKDEANKSGGVTKYYLGLELVDRAPDAARTMLDSLEKSQG
jgi:hypothetical protein